MADDLLVQVNGYVLASAGPVGTDREEPKIDDRTYPNTSTD